LSIDLLVEEAIKRRKIFENLGLHLARIVEVIKRLDPEAEVYLFGSVAEGKYLLSSDIDVLVVTVLNPGLVLAELWRNGVEEPFEVHVVDHHHLELYKKSSRLIRIDGPGQISS
jgi:hypothetical protein